MDASASKKRILILGGGFGGVATPRLERRVRRRPDMEIVLASRDNFVVMTPLLFEVFSGCVGSAGMGQTGLLVKLEDGNKDCEWIYRFRANPGRPWGGIVPPAPVLAPGSALGSRPRVALSSAQAPSM